MYNKCNNTKKRKEVYKLEGKNSPLLISDIAVYIKEICKKIQLINEFSKDVKHKDSILKEPLTSASKNMNYLGINLINYV